MNKTHAFALTLLALCSHAIAAPMGCLIEPERTTEVGSPVIGVIERIEVERGQSVRRGQILAVLRADVERATLDAAASRAENDADLKAAAASAAFNRERLVRAEDLYRQQFISLQALEQTRTEAQLADQKLAQAKEQRVVSKHERGVAEAQLSQRVIRSPIDGVVSERYLTPGERVDDKPLLRIARVDPLRVQLVVPISMYGQVQAGSYASVMPELPGAVAVQARVKMIDRVVDAASNTFRVQLDLPNANGALPAGLRCKAEFAGLAAQPAAGKPALSTPMPSPLTNTGPNPNAVRPAAAARAGGIALALTLALPNPPVATAVAADTAPAPARRIAQATLANPR